MPVASVPPTKKEELSRSEDEDKKKDDSFDDTAMEFSAYMCKKDKTGSASSAGGDKSRDKSKVTWD